MTTWTQTEIDAANKAHFELGAVEAVFRDIGAPWDYGQNAAVNVQRLIAAVKAKDSLQIVTLTKQVEQLREALVAVSRLDYLQEHNALADTVRKVLDQTKP